MIRATLTLITTLASSAAHAADPRPGFAVVGYLPSYSVGRFDTANATHYTDIILFSLKPNPDASLDTSGITPKALAYAKSLSAARPDIRLAVAIGGWGNSNAFPTVAANPELRATLVGHLTRFCESNQLTGIDFDWEHPRTPTDRDHYTALVAEAAAAFQPRGWRVTAAVAAWQSLDASFADQLDRLHLMAYDYSGRHATLEHATTAIDSLLTLGIDANKICLGLPFYGRQIDNRANALSYANILKQHPPTSPASDESAGYFFNGPATITAKTDLALSRNLAGVMVWEIGQDAHAPFSLAAQITTAREAASQP